MIMPNYSRAYYRRALVKRKLKDYQGEMLDCNKAIQYDPTFAMAYLCRGYAKEKLGRKEEAIKDFIKAYSLGIKNVSIEKRIRGGKI